jgi:hypothetical protein
VTPWTVRSPTTPTVKGLPEVASAGAAMSPNGDEVPRGSPLGERPVGCAARALAYHRLNDRPGFDALRQRGQPRHGLGGRRRL